MDHKAFVFAAAFLDGGDSFFQKRKDVHIDRVHLGMEFKAQHAVADIPHAGGPVFQQGRSGAFDVFQKQNALGACDLLIRAID